MQQGRGEKAHLAAEACADTWQDGGHTAVVCPPQEHCLLPDIKLERRQGILRSRGVEPRVWRRVAPQAGLLNSETLCLTCLSEMPTLGSQHSLEASIALPDLTGMSMFCLQHGNIA